MIIGRNNMGKAFVICRSIIFISSSSSSSSNCSFDIGVGDVGVKRVISTVYGGGF